MLSDGPEAVFFEDPNTRRKNPWRSLAGVESGEASIAGLLNEIVGLGAGGSSDADIAGGGSSPSSVRLASSLSAPRRMELVPMVSGRIFLAWLVRDDLMLFRREATGVRED